MPGPLPLFPPDSWWNVDVSSAPLEPNGTRFDFFSRNAALHPDFGGDSSPSPEIYGMVYVTVSGAAAEALEPVAFDYVDESDAGAPGRPSGYPIPAAAKTQSKWIEGGYPGNADVGGDKHMLIVDVDHRLLFETWNTRCRPATSPSCSWQAGSGAVFPLDSIQRRPDGWTSADAAGLAILPGLVRYDEAFGPDPIRHALRFTLQTSNGYVFPASHNAPSGSGSTRPPLGLRLRLKQGVDISGFAAPVRKIFQAMKTYGLILADNGSDMYIQGTYDTRWDNGVLNPAFASLHASDFEVIQLGWKPAVAAVSGPGSFQPLTPCRLLDTRDPPGPRGGPALLASTERVVAVAGICGVPADARAVALNVTSVNAPGPGALKGFPGDGSPSDATLLSFRAGRTRANNAVIMLSSSGSGTIALRNESSAGAADVLIDVAGYFK